MARFTVTREERTAQGSRWDIMDSDTYDSPLPLHSIVIAAQSVHGTWVDEAPLHRRTVVHEWEGWA